MIDNIGSFIMLDKKLLPSLEATAFFENNDGVEKKENIEKSQEFFKAENVTSVYEVLRIIDGKPLFLKDHFERLTSSLESAGMSFIVSFDEVKDSILQLISKNKQDGMVNNESLQYNNCNVRIIFSEGYGIKRNMYYVAKSSYPSMDDYNHGVSLSLIQIERTNPNVKQINVKYKDAVTKRIEDQEVFEVLLVNHEGFITEGSRSNVFFIKNRKVFTAPGEVVLRGITRQYVFEACRRAGIEVIEAMLTVDEMKSCEGVFISGTSIKALPIASIDGEHFQSAKLPEMKDIIKRFDEIIYESIK